MKKILAIDDQKANLITIKAVIESHLPQCIVLTALSGEEGIEIAQRELPNTILLDIKMPIMDGFETCKRLKEGELTKYISVVMITATSSDTESRVRAFDIGADAFLTKPIDPIELVAQIKVMLRIKEVEDKLKEINLSLESKIAEQTKHLRAEIEERKHTQIVLEKAKVKAEQSDKLKSAFLKNISHEIRTPLNAILGFSQLLIDPNTDMDEKKESYQYVEGGCDNLLRIINDILHLALIESEDEEPNIVECSLNMMLRSIKEEFLNDELTDTNVLDFKLSIDDKDKEQLVLIDSERVRMTISKLLSNAFKFTEKGFVEFGYSFKKDNILEFYIKDSGMGIPAEQLDDVFNVFRQLEEVHEKKYSGTGVGLAIVRKLIKTMGGDIHIKSTFGEGTSVFFSVPYIKIVQLTDDFISEEDLLNGLISWDDKTILIAEDLRSNYLILEQTYRMTGVNILWAKNGEEAIKIYLENPKIDLILMDIQMPIMDGFEATKQIREINKKVPIIAQTSYVTKNDNKVLLQKGFSDLILKPINTVELIQKTNNQLKSTFHK